MQETIDQRESDQIADIIAPEQTADLVGHRDVFARLERQLLTDRMPSGILLHGPRGIGKATLAFKLAQRIFEATGDENADRVAEQVSAGVHPNLFVLRRKLRDDGKAFFTVIRVDEVRALTSRMQQTRGRAGHRVCIVDAIDDCNASSANALLKILEEPPTDTHFVLISHRPGQLLPTIRSRCQAHPMRPLPDTDVAAILGGRTDAEPEDVNRAIQLAGGRPRRAMEALAVVDNPDLQKLQTWLAAPVSGNDLIPLKLAEALSGTQKPLEAGFAREVVLNWIANEAIEAGEAGAQDRTRLASANALWEKSGALFSDADTFNLDPRQTLITLLDAIKHHARLVSDRQSA